MSRKTAVLTSWTLLAPLLISAAARGADVFDAIPDTALTIVLANRLEETSDKIERLARQVQAPSVSLLTLARVQTGIHAGLDEKGTAALAIMPKDDGQSPQAVIFLPVTDYAKFLEQLQPTDAGQDVSEIQLVGRPMLVCKQGDYAAITNPDAKAVLQDVRSSIKAVGSAMSPMRTWLAEADLAVVVPPAGIKFGVEQGRKQVQQLRGLLGALGGQQPAQAQQQLNDTLAAAEALLKSVDTELTHLALGARVDEGGALHGVSRVRFAPGGEWAAAARGAKTPKQGLLAGLPRGPFWATFGAATPKAWREGVRKFMETTVNANPAFAQMPADQRAKFVKALNDMTAPMESFSMWLGPPAAGEGLFSNMVGIVKVDDTKQYLTQYEEAINAMPAALGGQAPALAYEVKHIDVDGQTGLEVITDLSSLNQPAMAQFKPVFEKLYGPQQKLRAYIAAADEHTVVMAYIKVENLQQALKAAKDDASNPAEEPGVAETAALLPSGAQWIGFIQPQSSWLQAVAPPGTNVPELPAVPPIGMAAKISPAGFQGELAVPAATLEALGTLGAKLRGQ